MPELNEAQLDLQAFGEGLKRLEAEYNGFFSGRERRPPVATRARVEALVKRLDRSGVASLPSADRFRFQTLQARYHAFVDLWDRGLRAREEGRPGPFTQPRRAEPAEKTAGEPQARVLHVTAFRDPVREADKLHSLYESLMEARRQNGDEVVPFHRFATLVKNQVMKLKESGSPEVAFRVAVKDGKVNFTVRGVKGGPA